MAQMITRFSVHKTALFFAQLYAAFGFVFGLIGGLVSIADGQAGQGIFFIIVFPFLYGLIMYPIMALFCWIYNVIGGNGKRGIVFEMKEVE